MPTPTNLDTSRKKIVVGELRRIQTHFRSRGLTDLLYQANRIKREYGKAMRFVLGRERDLPVVKMLIGWQAHDIYASTLGLVQRIDKPNPPGTFLTIDEQFVPSGPFSESKALVNGLKIHPMPPECVAFIRYYCLCWRFENWKIEPEVEYHLPPCSVGDLANALRMLGQSKVSTFGTAIRELHLQRSRRDVSRPVDVSLGTEPNSSDDETSPAIDPPSSPRAEPAYDVDTASSLSYADVDLENPEGAEDDLESDDEGLSDEDDDTDERITHFVSEALPHHDPHDKAALTYGHVSIEASLDALRQAISVQFRETLPTLHAVHYMPHNQLDEFLPFACYVGDYCDPNDPPRLGRHVWAFFLIPNINKKRAPVMELEIAHLPEDGQSEGFRSSDNLDVSKIIFDAAFEGVRNWAGLYAMVKYYRLLIAEAERAEFYHHYIPVNLTFLRNLAYVCGRSPKEGLDEGEEREHFQYVHEKSGTSAPITSRQSSPKQGQRPDSAASTRMDVDETGEAEYTSDTEEILAAHSTHAAAARPYHINKNEVQHSDITYASTTRRYDRDTSPRPFSSPTKGRTKTTTRSTVYRDDAQEAASSIPAGRTGSSALREIFNNSSGSTESRKRLDALRKRTAEAGMSMQE